MIIDLNNFRKDYKKSSLLESNLPKNPIHLFHEWFQNEKKIHFKKQEEINAMSISTIGKDGGPETRIVLLKEYSDDGFVFYTNYYSMKGRSIQNNPKVSLSFFWQETERQILIKGITHKINQKKSDEYFHGRPQENKISSWASKQSQIILSKKKLIQEYEKWNFFFQKRSISRPFYWGGYIVNPYKIEFWQGQPNRLHDRIVYTLIKEKKWILQRLSP